jgi:hypothetical protein
MSVTRREFLVTAALLPVVAIPGGPQSPGGSESVLPVVSFHLDQPYLDLTGLEKPYVPPAGLRSGAPLAALSEEEILSRYYGFI